MTNLSPKLNLKRKNDDNFEEELFFNYENQKKSKSEKDSKTSLNKIIDINHNNSSPKSIQSKLPFKSIQSPNFQNQRNKLSEKIQTEQKLDEEEWHIKHYLIDEVWKKLLTEEFEKPYFKKINDTIEQGYKKNIVRPPKELVFNALNSTSLNQIKCVIIGQDPYHDDGQAHGLAFSVPKGVKLPPSLKNIFTELKNDIPEFERDENLGGCLQKWTDQGVFLLNTFLTVEAHKAGSHSRIGWDIFTDKVIKIISEKNNGCAFLLWGNFAQKKESLIDKKKHKIIKCAHPSPFSVTKFFNSKCFSQANNYLISIGKTAVNWSLKNK